MQFLYKVMRHNQSTEISHICKKYKMQLDVYFAQIEIVAKLYILKISYMCLPAMGPITYYELITLHAILLWYAGQ